MLEAEVRRMNENTSRTELNLVSLSLSLSLSPSPCTLVSHLLSCLTPLPCSFGPSLPPPVLSILFLCLRASNSRGRRHYVVSVHHIFVNVISQECLEGISSKLALRDEPIRFWWSKVKVTVTSCSSHSREHYISGTPGGNVIHLAQMSTWTQG